MNVLRALVLVALLAGNATAPSRPDFAGRWTTDPDPAAAAGGGGAGGAGRAGGGGRGAAAARGSRIRARDERARCRRAMRRRGAELIGDLHHPPRAER